MKQSYRLMWTVAIAAALVSFASSCQSSSTTTPEETGPVVYPLTIGVSSTARQPDSGSWTTLSGSDSGTAPFVCTTVNGSIKCTDTIHLAKPIATTDTVKVRAWSWGIQICAIRLIGTGSPQTLKWVDLDSIVLNLALLDSFATLRSSKSDSFKALGHTLGAGDLVGFYARLLLKQNSAVKGFPAVLPIGMDANRVKDSLVHAAQMAGMAPSEIVGMKLGIDTLQIHEISRRLVQAGVLKAADTLVWQHPLRVQAPLSLSSSAVVAGDVVSLSGAFHWNAKLVVSPVLEVRTENGVDTSHFRFSNLRFIYPNDTSWTLSGNLSLVVSQGAKAGIDTVVVGIADASGNVLRSSAIVRVLGASAPKLSVTNPVRKDTAVLNNVARFNVVATVSDTMGPDTVQIGSTKFASAPYADSVPLSVGPNMVVVQAWNRTGLRVSDTVTITRAKSPGDTNPPTVVRVAPASQDTIVDYDTKTVSLSWTVYDDSALAAVNVDGSSLTSSSALYSSKQNLSVGPNTFVLQALDAHGNPRRDTVRVKRLPDTTKPVLSRGANTRDTVLSTDRKSIPLSWNVTDNALRSVTIGGVAQAGRGEVYSDSLPVSGDSIWIRIVAKDSSDNTTTDSVRVCKLRNPTIHPASFPVPALTSVTVLILAATPGDSVEYSYDNQQWTGYSTGLFINTTKSVYARALRYGTVSPVSRAAFAFPVRLDVPTAVVADSIVVSVDTVGLDSVQLSTDTASGWMRGSRLVVRQTGNVFARGWLGGIASFPTTASCLVVHDTSLASVAISDWQGRVNATISGGIIRLDSLHPVGGRFALSVRATDSVAQVSVGGGQADSFALSQDTTIVVSVKSRGYTGRHSIHVVFSKRLRDSLIDVRDGHVYKATKIGNQWWMAQNLNYRNSTGRSDTVGKCDSSMSSKCEAAGRLYDWNQATKGLCGVGWHLPTFDEWILLKRSLPDSSKAGQYLKNSRWSTGAEGGDRYGFNAVAGGWINVAGTSMQWNEVGYWWSASAKDSTTAWGSAILPSPDNMLLQYAWVKTDYFSVRCVRD